jgi:hypothetical protein
MNQPQSQAPAFDASIPVLTEVLQETPAAAAAAPAEAAQTGHGAVLEEQAVPAWAGQDWAALEKRLSERILHELQGQVDFALEQRLAEVLQQALQGLSDEIRKGVQQSMEKIVSQAVSQELMHCQTLKK